MEIVVDGESLTYLEVLLQLDNILIFLTSQVRACSRIGKMSCLE
jgi:hypothetical protein